MPLITNLQYGFSTGGGTADPGSYDLRATATGTDTVALQQDGVTIEANTSYVFVVIGKPGSTEQPLTLVTVSAASRPNLKRSRVETVAYVTVSFSCCRGMAHRRAVRIQE
ncbi:MAG: hypothetical protein R2848_01810 [Thermomicrobiales bacterium]